MQYRKLYRDGPEVSVIALGCGGFEGKSAQELSELLDYAEGKGINFFDLYSADPVLRSNLGQALAGRRDRFVIQGHIGSAWEDGQYVRTRNPLKLREAFEDELLRLRTPYLDVGMIHYVDSDEDWEQVTEGGMADYVHALKAQGRIRATGLSSHNAEVAQRAIKSGLIDVLMFSINPCYDMQPSTDNVDLLWADESYAHKLHNQNEQRRKLYELCEAHGVGIDVMKAFGGGDLLSAELSPFKRAFTPAQCLHYALTRPAVASVMCGCKDAAEVDAALEYLHCGDEQRDYSQLLSGLERFTFSGHCLYCGHCAPCPVGIDVAFVTKLLNLCKARGFVPETEREHYTLLTSHAGDCIGCGACESRCPFEVRIRENLRTAKEVFGK